MKGAGTLLPGCRQCSDCVGAEPDADNVCHPLEDCDDEGEPVFACKHCDRAVPWRFNEDGDEDLNFEAIVSIRIYEIEPDGTAVYDIAGLFDADGLRKLRERLDLTLREIDEASDA